MTLQHVRDVQKSRGIMTKVFDLREAIYHCFGFFEDGYAEIFLKEDSP
jgi:hypothetical protein